MKKHIFFTAVFVLFGLFLTTAASAQGHYGHGRGHNNKHYYKEQRRMDKAYTHGYRQGRRDDYRYERRRDRVAYCPPVYRPRHRRYYRQAPVVYMPPAPRPYYGGGISINIPLPPLPPHP